MNRKRKIVFAITLTLILLLDVALIALLFWEYRKNGQITQTQIVRTALLMVASVFSIIKLVQRTQYSKSRRSPKLYRDQYPVLLDHSFLENPKLEKRFFAAVDAVHLGGYERAIRQLEKLLTQVESVADRFAVQFFLGLSYSRLSIYPKAIVWYRQALQLKQNVTAASNLGLCYQRMGNRKEAEEAYRLAIQIDPSDAYAYNNLAHLYLTDGDYEAALPLATQAVERKSDFAIAYSAQAIAYAMLNDEKNYQIALKKAVANGYNREDLCAYIRSLQDRGEE